MLGKTLSSTYPGPLSCHVMALYDPAGGLLMAALDPTGQVKRLCAKGDLNIGLSVSQLRLVTPGAGMVDDPGLLDLAQRLAREAVSQLWVEEWGMFRTLRMNRPGEAAMHGSLAGTAVNPVVRSVISVARTQPTLAHGEPHGRVTAPPGPRTPTRFRQSGSPRTPSLSRSSSWRR